MRPKYEIGQELYYCKDKIKIAGIKQGTISEGANFWYLHFQPGAIWDQDIWTSEQYLSITPPDNKKYYVLYRSADGLERREDHRVYDTSNPKFRSLKCPEPTCTLGKGEREYRYKETIERDNTVTYIYDEVI